MAVFWCHCIDEEPSAFSEGLIAIRSRFGRCGDKRFYLASTILESIKQPRSCRDVRGEYLAARTGAISGARRHSNDGVNVSPLKQGKTKPPGPTLRFKTKLRLRDRQIEWGYKCIAEKISLIAQLPLARIEKVIKFIAVDYG